MENKLTRRSSLVALGGLVAGAAGWQAEGAGAGPAAVASGAVACVLTPEMTEGPYYVAGEAVRRNITEGRPGTSLALRLTVVNASTCKPIARANVDVWHADALGVYSGVQGNTGTFMRGIQPTNAHGVALFDTVYPGWYTGRTVHIHVKVHLGGNVVHTGQLFFPDTLTDKVYRASPYESRGARDTRNSTDAIFRNGGSRSMLTISRGGPGYVAAITMGVHRT
jgi:protocatechuate 3,4-dioxygenase beta subunit